MDNHPKVLGIVYLCHLLQLKQAGMKKGKNIFFLFQIHTMGTNPKGVLFKKAQYLSFGIHIPDQDLAALFRYRAVALRIKGIDFPFSILEQDMCPDAFPLPVKVDFGLQRFPFYHLVHRITGLNTADPLRMGQHLRNKALPVFSGKKQLPASRAVHDADKGHDVSDLIDWRTVNPGPHQNIGPVCCQVVDGIRQFDIHGKILSLFVHRKLNRDGFPANPYIITYPAIQDSPEGLIAHYGEKAFDKGIRQTNVFIVKQAGAIIMVSFVQSAHLVQLMEKIDQ